MSYDTIVSTPRPANWNKPTRIAQAVAMAIGWEEPEAPIWEYWRFHVDWAGNDKEFWRTVTRALYDKWIRGEGSL